ncbi:MAG: hypothetical protein RQ833_03320 [Sphingomonadaceae bacterium]|nr:hypothetical protein [Sphingomonadaceae bacterium]
MTRDSLLRLGIAAVALAAAAAPAWAASTPAQEAARRARPAQQRTPVTTRALSTFTPSIGASAGASVTAGAGADLQSFRFTPSGQANPSKSFTLGMRARPLSVPDASHAPDEPAGYDVGVALGTRGVALTGQTTAVETGLARKEAVAVGLGYGRRNWTAQVKVGEERENLRGADKFGPQQRYSFELGGAYTITRSLSLGAGVRYRVAPETNADARARAEDRSAFLGLGVAF